MKPSSTLKYQGQLASLAGAGQQRNSWRFIILNTRFEFTAFGVELISTGPLFAIGKLLSEDSTLGTIKIPTTARMAAKPLQKGSKGLVAFLGTEQGRPIAGAYWELEAVGASPAVPPVNPGRLTGFVVRVMPDNGLEIKENGLRGRLLTASPHQVGAAKYLPGTPVSFLVASLNGKPAAMEVRPLILA